MGLTEIQTLLRKARSDPRRILERSRKAIAAFSNSLRPNLQRRRPGNVTMLHVGRSGSTVLGDMLDQHPRVYWDGEVYHRSLQDPSKVGDPFHFLARRMLRAGSSYYGFEVKPVHLRTLNLEIQEFITTLDRLRFTHFIILERKNHLRRLLSGVIARRSTVFHRAPGDPLARSRVAIDVTRIKVVNTTVPLLDFLTWYEEFFASLRDLLDSSKTLWLTYEADILDDPVVGYGKTLSFLGIEAVSPPKISYGKTNPYPVEAMVSNFGELKGALQGTRFEWMLYE
ncbi:MAG: hypothetical protein ACREK3_07725 [Gemmatimonadota bacterium]